MGKVNKKQEDRNKPKKCKLKKDDKVVVLAGKDKGKLGNILKIENNQHVLVEGVNIIKKHQKANPQKGEQGGIVEKEQYIHVSNVAIYNPETNKADRVHFQINDQGIKTRVFASNNEVIDL